MSEKNSGCGCFGCLIEIIALIIICAIFSLFCGSGEFYNRTVKAVTTIVSGDTIVVKR